MDGFTFTHVSPIRSVDSIRLTDCVPGLTHLFRAQSPAVRREQLSSDFPHAIHSNLDESLSCQHDITGLHQSLEPLGANLSICSTVFPLSHSSQEADLLSRCASSPFRRGITLPSVQTGNHTTSIQTLLTIDLRPKIGDSRLPVSSLSFFLPW